MTSFVYTEMEKLNPRTVLHERETTSSGRPKPTHGPSEDAENYYTYSRTGKVAIYPKTESQKYNDFLWNNVIYKNESNYGRTGTLNQVTNNIMDNILRLTPATDYEISMGFGATNPASITKQYYIQQGRNVHPNPRDLVTAQTQEKSKEYFRKLQEAEDKARKLAEEQRLAKLRESARPNPREVEKAKPVEVEPIKEAAKYSPLMIAGVIAVVVILLLKRRRA